MPKYTDDEIRNMKKITCKIAGEYLGISSMAVSMGMRSYRSRHWSSSITKHLPDSFTVSLKNSSPRMQSSILCPTITSLDI